MNVLFPVELMKQITQAQLTYNTFEYIIQYIDTNSVRIAYSAVKLQY